MSVTVGVTVGVSVCVGVNVIVGVELGVPLGVALGAMVLVSVGLAVGVRLGVPVGVTDGVAVERMPAALQPAPHVSVLEKIDVVQPLLMHNVVQELAAPLSMQKPPQAAPLHAQHTAAAGRGAARGRQATLAATQIANITAWRFAVTV